MLDYQATTAEKLLGANYKWWYILQFKFKSRTTSVFDNALFVTGQIIILLGSLVVWWLANNKIIDTSLQEKWTYFVIGELFLNLVFNFAEFEGFDILRGNVTADLLRPQKYLKQKFFDTYGEASLQNLNEQPRSKLRGIRVVRSRTKMAELTHIAVCSFFLGFLRIFV